MAPITTVPCPQGASPPGLVTLTGITVAVLGCVDSGYVVRTPCGNAATVSTGSPINGARVVIDPGHGGPVYTGAVGPNGLVERDLNFTLGQAVIDELNRRGIPSISTRTGNYPTLISVRTLFADAINPQALVSIHHNAPTPAASNTPGTEVYVQSTASGGVRADSARLGGLLYEAVTTALAKFDGITWGRASTAGVLRVLSSEGKDAYGMVRRPAIPAVLVEYGYLSNPAEAELFTTDAYISATALATADAIDAYLNTERSGTGFVEQPRFFNPQPSRIECAEPALE